MPLQEFTDAERRKLDEFAAVEPLAESAVERVAVAIYEKGAYCGGCDYDGWDSCSECRGCCRGYARAALQAMKPEPSR